MTQGPLHGVRVLDITHVMAGAYCSLLLADMGADVVKIEPPRTVGDRSGLAAGSFDPVNRNKRSLAIDMKSEGGRATVRRMAAEADIVVQNFRPGAMERLGLGYDDLREVNPDLIYCSISGYGSTGPYRDRPGFDLVAQAASGIMSINGDADRPPTKIGIPISDLNAGTFGAMGVLSAYIHLLRTGEGQHVDTSLLEGALAYTVWDSSTYFDTGAVPTRSGSAHRLTAPYEVYASSDGYFVIGAANQSTWIALTAAIGRPDLVDVPEFRAAETRVANRVKLNAELSAAFATATTEEWCERLLAAGVPAGPIHDVAEAWSDPQVIARGMQVSAPGVDGAPKSFIGPPVHLSATPWGLERGVPGLGADTRDVLGEYGFAPDEVDALVESGAVLASEASASPTA